LRRGRGYAKKKRTWCEPASSFHRYVKHTRSYHAECAGGAQRNVDNAASDEWSSIVDATSDRAAGVRYSDDASKRPRSVSTGHFTGSTVPTIKRRYARFCLGGSSCKKAGGYERDSIHGRCSQGTMSPLQESSAGLGPPACTGGLFVGKSQAISGTMPPIGLMSADSFPLRAKHAVSLGHGIRRLRDLG
jgi:hypothetical protein